MEECTCAARLTASRKLTPFSEQWRCPECREWHPSYWSTLCTGGRSFVLKEASGSLWWKVPAVVFACDLPDGAPRHIHMACKRCGHRWGMLTATESEAADRGPDSDPPPGRPRPVPVEEEGQDPEPPTGSMVG